MDDPCALVRATSEWVVAQPSAVTIDDGAVTALADALDIDELYTLKAFDADLHLCNPPDSPELTCAYLLVVDTLNFCFWPDAAAGGAELQYADLAGGVKRAVLRDPTCISAPALAAITEEGVQRLVGWRRPLPLAAERARLLREAGAALVAGYGGSAAALVRAAGGSAVQLVRLLTTDMPGFRDQAVYAGRQVFFYKRAQIFAGDLYGAFGGQGLGAFRDVAQLTMFAGELPAACAPPGRPAPAARASQTDAGTRCVQTIACRRFCGRRACCSTPLAWRPASTAWRRSRLAARRRWRFARPRWWRSSGCARRLGRGTGGAGGRPWPSPWTGCCGRRGRRRTRGAGRTTARGRSSTDGRCTAFRSGVKGYRCAAPPGEQHCLRPSPFPVGQLGNKVSSVSAAPPCRVPAGRAR